MSVSAIEKIVEADLLNATKIYCETVMNEAASVIQGFAAEAMQSYYDAYDPIDAYNMRVQADPSKEFDKYSGPYIRTEQFLNNSFQKFTQKQGKYYMGGVKILSGFTNHDPKGVSEEQLYEYVWDKGIHGFSGRLHTVKDEGVHQGTHLEFELNPIYGNDGRPRDRFSEVEKRAYSAATKEKIMSKAMGAVRNGSYSIIRFR